MFGIIVGNRDVFPSDLAKQGRLDTIEVLKELGFGYVVLEESDTQLGVVERYEVSKKCANLFKENREVI